MGAEKYRKESDSLGEVSVPETVYWGAQTQRAIDNFPVSGICFSRAFIRALGMVKMAAAEVNRELELLGTKRAGAIIDAAQEVVDGGMDTQFPLDIFQTGSGTSTNMNANEVIANRANELLGGKRGDKTPIHPNDHVNMGQSSNDVIPTCIHIAACEQIVSSLIPSCTALKKSLEKKSAAFDHVLKIGRTHLQDATPVRLGQEFGGYASMAAKGIERIQSALVHLRQLALGGTAVGTGINTHREFAGAVIRIVSDRTGIDFIEADNHFEAQGSRDAVVAASGALKSVAVGMIKIANDIRWLGSGPRCGLGEVSVPAVQPGSSIMPGKVNPVLAESICQIAAQVIGNDTAIAVGGMSGNFELNVMMPVMCHNLLQSIEILSNGIALFTSRCIDGLEAEEQRCRESVEKSLALCTALAKHIGYDAAAEIAKEAWRTGKTVRETARERAVLPPGKIDEVLDAWSMTEAQ
jgi:fumarate hydratase class II